jgi:hypothetical protein
MGTVRTRSRRRAQSILLCALLFIGCSPKVKLSKEAREYLNRSLIVGLQPFSISSDQLPDLLTRIDTFIDHCSDLKLCVREPYRLKTCDLVTDKFGYEFILSQRGDSLRVEVSCTSFNVPNGITLRNSIVAKYYLRTGDLPPPGVVPRSGSEAEQQTL